MLRKIGWLTIFFTIILFLNLKTEARAQERALVTLDHYDVLNGVVAPGDLVKLSLTFKNKSNVTAQDVMIYAYNPNGDIFPIFGEENPLYIGELEAGGTFQKDVTISISDNLIKNNYLQLNFNVAYHDKDSEDKNNTAFLSIPVRDDCRLKMDDIVANSEFTALQNGIIAIIYRNTGKKIINDLEIEISGNIEGKTLKYDTDSLGVGIKNKIDCYIKFLKAGDQNLSIKAYYTDDDGKQHLLDEGNITIKVANSIVGADNHGLKESGLQIQQLIQQGVIILLSLIAILVVVLWKNSRTKLMEKEAR